MKTKIFKIGSLFITVIITFIVINGCTSIKQTRSSKAVENNTLTDKEKKEGWKLLFDGKTFNGWRGLGMETVPQGLWIIENGTIRKVDVKLVPKLPDGKTAPGGDLITINNYENYELYFEWNSAGNSGLKYNVDEEMSQKYGSRYAALGFEYQLLGTGVEDGNVANKGQIDKHSVGALYDLIIPKYVPVKPVGEYNISRILIDGNHVEHWLNGIKVVEYELGSQLLDSAYLISKFNKIPHFQDKRNAHIVLQNHPGDSWFRNIKIREITKK
jgi:hypothetical protein